MTMATFDAIREMSQAAGLLAVALFALLQVRLNRLMRKRIAQLEMLVYWQQQFERPNNIRRKNDA